MSPYKMTDRDIFQHCRKVFCVDNTATIFLLMVLRQYVFYCLPSRNYRRGKTCTNWMHQSSGIWFYGIIVVSKWIRCFVFSPRSIRHCAFHFGSTMNRSDQIKIYAKVTQLHTRCTWLESLLHCIRDVCFLHLNFIPIENVRNVQSISLA